MHSKKESNKITYLEEKLLGIMSSEQKALYLEIEDLKSQEFAEMHSKYLCENSVTMCRKCANF